MYAVSIHTCRETVVVMVELATALQEEGIRLLLFLSQLSPLEYSELFTNLLCKACMMKFISDAKLFLIVQSPSS